MNTDAPLDRMYQRTLHGIKLGLETEEGLLARLEKPHHHFAAIHVAGTNGKGSVCAMLDAILRAAGYPVGIYTSPHLVRFNERIRVGGELITDEELGTLIAEVEEHDRAAVEAGGRPATFFEFSTAIAFEYFRRKEAALAILETGLGGRLDSTNVVVPLLSVITSIDLDHTQYLGESIEKIAGEKAGIIKPGRPVVCGRLVPEALEVVRRMAKERGAPLLMSEDLVSVSRLEQSPDGQKIKVETRDGGIPPFRLPLLGRHQLENAAVALAVLEVLSDTVSVEVDEEAVAAGMENLDWPARFQVLGQDPLVVLDAAHNPAGARALLRTLKELGRDKNVAFVVSFSHDKDCRGFMKAIAGSAGRCWIARISNPRAMPVEEIQACAQNAGLEAEVNTPAEAVQAATAWAREQGSAVCITGSIYLAGEILAG